VCRLVGELDHPDPGAKLKELDPPKGLGEQIRKLVLGVDVARLEVPFLQAASNEVVPHPDVLAPFMKNGVLCQGQSGFVVHPEFHRSSVSAEEITKQSNKPERLSRSGGGCYVLSLAAGQGHHLLLDRLPANETLAKEEEDPTRALTGVDVVGVVVVVVPDNLYHLIHSITPTCTTSFLWLKVGKFFRSDTLLCGGNLTNNLLTVNSLICHDKSLQKKSYSSYSNSAMDI
jgi:hypothetical protein